MTPKNILISRTDNIGDVVLTLPMAGYLKKHFPNSTITFLGKSYTQPVIALSQHVDDFLNWDEILKMSLKLQTNIFSQYDTVIHVFPNKKVAQLAKVAKIKSRIATSHRWYHWLTCNKLATFSRRKSELHEAQLNFKLLSPLNIPTDIEISEIKNLYGFRVTTSLPNDILSLIDNHKFNLLIHPKSKGSAREWGLDNFSRLIDILPQDKFKIFVSGTKDEGVLISDFLKKHQDKIVDLTGKMTLEHFIAFINQSDGMLAASTGPLHIASALGKHALGLYAPMRPIHPGRWKPIGENAHFFVKDTVCSDCRKSMDCQCIRSITPEEVANYLLKIM